MLRLLGSVSFCLFLLLLPKENYYYCQSFTVSSSSSSLSRSSLHPNKNKLLRHNHHHHPSSKRTNTKKSSCCLHLSTITPPSSSQIVGPRISIDEEYPGLTKIYSNPDIFVIKEFLDTKSCRDIIERASIKKLERSPVAYGGWTDDIKDLVELAAKGPVAWIALIGAWFQLKDSSDSDNTIKLVIQAVENYAIVLMVAIVAIVAFTWSRAENLKGMRTSTSTTLDDISNSSSGPTKFVIKAATLFSGDDTSIKKEASLFEAPTVIRYEPDQVLAPHYDANRSASIEDANRGGQTLATLIVYLNDVSEGGLTRFGKLPATTATTNRGDDGGGEETNKFLTIQPKMGDAILFFPADSNGNFDERTEHEGCKAIDEKWIARIWRHENRVPPPFGLSESSINNI